VSVSLFEALRMAPYGDAPGHELYYPTRTFPLSIDYRLLIPSAALRMIKKSTFLAVSL